MGSTSSNPVSSASSGIQSDISGSSKNSQNGSAMKNGSAMLNGSAMINGSAMLNGSALKNGSAMFNGSGTIGPNGSAMNQNGSAMNQNGSALNQNGSAMNQNGSALNKGGYSAVKTGKASSGMPKSSYATAKPGMRHSQSESALQRNDSGSGSGIKQKSGSAANPLNEEDEMENEINELVRFSSCRINKFFLMLAPCGVHLRFNCSYHTFPYISSVGITQIRAATALKSSNVLNPEPASDVIPLRSRVP